MGVWVSVHAIMDKVHASVAWKSEQSWWVVVVVMEIWVPDRSTRKNYISLDLCHVDGIMV